MQIKNKALLLIIVGSALEYYDFVLYGLLANYIGKAFFPFSDSSLQLIKSFSIFALGYLIRPLSGTILGFIADKYYRRVRIFSLSLLLMGISTCAIGLTPSYENIGIASPLLLALARLVQGMSFASELPGAVTILSSSYFAKYKPVSKSIGYLMGATSFGFILASLIVYLTHLFLTEEQIYNWGWRIPFVLGGIIAILGYFIRRTLEKTEEIKEYAIKKEESNFSLLSYLVIENNKLLLRGLGITCLIALGTIFFIYLPHFLEDNYTFQQKTIKLAVLVGLVSFSTACNIFGTILKNANYRLFFMFVSATFPIAIFILINLIDKLRTSFSLFLLFIIYEIYMAALYVSGLRILAELFPVKIKNTSISFCYNFAFSVLSLTPVLFNYSSAFIKLSHIVVLFFFLFSVFSIFSIYLEKKDGNHD